MFFGTKNILRERHSIYIHTHIHTYTHTCSTHMVSEAKASRPFVLNGVLVDILKSQLCILLHCYNIYYYTYVHNILVHNTIHDAHYILSHYTQYTMNITPYTNTLHTTLRTPHTIALHTIYYYTIHYKYKITLVDILKSQLYILLHYYIQYHYTVYSIH